MRTVSLLLAVSAGCLAFTGAGHTFGYFYPVVTEKEAALFKDMSSLKIDVFGSQRDHYTMYRGCSLLFSFAALGMSVMTAGLATQVRYVHNRTACALQAAGAAFANVGFSYVSSYAFFIAPAAFTGVAAVTAAAAAALLLASRDKQQ